MRSEGQSFVYIMSNWTGSVLYIGVTTDLKQRVFLHRTKYSEGFTKKYNVDRLVYYEMFADIGQAIFREKSLKKGTRMRKINLIQKMNPEWRDLYMEV